MKHIFSILVLLGLSAFAAVAQDETDCVLKARNDYPTTIALCTRAIEGQPGNERLYLLRAYLYLTLPGLEDIEAAVADIRMAVKLKPDDYYSVILPAANLLNKANRHAMARDILTLFIAANPKNGMALYTRSYSKRALGDRTSALEDINRALELEPNTYLYRELQRNIQQELTDPAAAVPQGGGIPHPFEAALRAAKSKDERDLILVNLSQFYWKRSNSYRGIGDLGNRLADAGRAVESSKTWYNYERRALIHLGYKMYEEAIADYTEAIKLSDHPKTLLLNRGEVYVRNKQYIEAVKDYDTALNHPETTDKLMIAARLAEIKRFIEP